MPIINLYCPNFGGQEKVLLLMERNGMFTKTIFYLNTIYDTEAMVGSVIIIFLISILLYLATLFLVVYSKLFTFWMG